VRVRSAATPHHRHKKSSSSVSRGVSRAHTARRSISLELALASHIDRAFSVHATRSAPGRHDRLLHIAAATLIAEGVLVGANRGDCPLGGLQDRLGDPVPLFELVLSPRAAKRAVPTLGAIAGTGLVLLVVRGRRDTP
jgi:hypothetical protein